MDTLITAALGLGLMAATILIHYEALRLTSARIQRLSIPLRTRILVVIAMAVVAHFTEVVLYAAGYHLLIEGLAVGRMEGHFDGGFLDYLYFSLSSYSSLGIGDIYPEGAVRLVAGLEALNGLLLIAWTASFTYLTMEQFWEMHRTGK